MWAGVKYIKYIIDDLMPQGLVRSSNREDQLTVVNSQYAANRMLLRVLCGKNGLIISAGDDTGTQSSSSPALPSSIESEVGKSIIS